MIVAVRRMGGIDWAMRRRTRRQEERGQIWVLGMVMAGCCLNVPGRRKRFVPWKTPGREKVKEMLVCYHIVHV